MVVKVTVKVAAAEVDHPVQVAAVAVRRAVEVTAAMELLHLQKPHKTEPQRSV